MTVNVNSRVYTHYCGNHLDNRLEAWKIPSHHRVSILECNKTVYESRNYTFFNFDCLNLTNMAQHIQFPVSLVISLFLKIIVGPRFKSNTKGAVDRTCNPWITGLAR